VTRRHNALPWISLVVVYFVWGSTYLGIRVAVTTIPPYLMTGVRYLIAGTLMFGLQWLATKQKPRLPSRSEMLRITIVAVLLLVIGNGFLCLAETKVESGTSALLLASTPIWLLLLDALLARKVPSVAAIAGVVLGTAGIALLVGKASGHADPLFAGIILIGSVSWAAGSIVARGNEHSAATTSLEMAVGGAISLVVGLLLGEAAQLRISAISGPSLWGMIWLITAGAMLGYTAYGYAVRTLPTTTVATYGYVNPVVAVILGAAILNEPVTWNIAAGGAAVIGSVVLILLGSRSVSRRDRASSSPSA
jgi:drug/metabolite transporter (DMT)-like permease